MGSIEMVSVTEQVELKLRYLDRLERLQVGASIHSEREYYYTRIVRVLDSIEEGLGLREPKPVNVGNLTVKLAVQVDEETIRDACDEVGVLAASAGSAISKAIENIKVSVK